MIKHVIIWKLKENLAGEELIQVRKGIQEGLEGLNGQIPGLIDIKVQIQALASSSGDLMLDSTFESEAALKGYSVHPKHVAVANEKVRPFTDVRMCMDYEI